MNKVRCLLFAVIFGVLTGCVTTSGTIGKQTLSADSEGDGAIRQKIEFKDLPADMQEAISHGG